jgi:plasmid maintenance system antidote protein VapI
MSPTGHGAEVDGVIADVLAIRELTPRHAEVLGTLFGISEEFWVNFERLYREGLEAGKVDLTK